MVDFLKVSDIEFDDIDYGDAMDFCDAFISNASIQNENGEWRAATEEELDEINDNRDFVYHSLLEYIY